MAKGRKTGGGSRAGVPNRLTSAVKDMILEALNQAGGVDYFVAQATLNPSAFMTLVGKVLPLQVAGANDGPILIVTGVTRATDYSEA
jgi:hypothetical protein